MSWALVIGLAAITFGAAAFLLKVGKGGWSLLGATLLFGLAGYGLQGSPGQPAAPGAFSAEQPVDGELLVTARREYFDSSQLPSRWIMTGDGFARRGDFEQAAGFYRSATEENPRDLEAWIALGIALVEHGEGNLTPAALYAFERAEALDASNGGARYFLGLSWLRAGQPLRTRELWIEALENAPEDATWRESLILRLLRLDAMLGITPPREETGE
ncbi:tetratricopeptide repeat protein [Qipengyuania aquimaris]|uniref:tetratricopeptide repeat protein n=1 Tax=Qipengyuania aquimaris TaxID=255984 RepID=UPI001FD1D017|nr:tetratricopeptide repeat protein [Qipengyuania aquimaris]UOR15235.1 tetratricopeptide repeat protein [Qipengyuania aquimaris]